MYKIATKENSDIVICDMMEHYADGTQKIMNCTKFDSIYTVAPSASNKIFRRTVIGNLRFLNGKWYEDFNFTTKILLNNPRISVISEPYYNYFIRNSSTMNNNNSLKNLDMLDIIDDLISYSKNNNIYDENIFKYIIFDHVLITSINRVALQKNIDSKKVILTLREYCHKNLKNYKRLPFYRTVEKKRKIIATLNYYSLHCLSRALLIINSKIGRGSYGKI